MLKEFSAYIKKENLFSTSEKILLAVSGGIDSVVMCELFQRAGLNFGIAHCNFLLRGKESEGDVKLVFHLAERFNVPLSLRVFNATTFAESKNISIQMSARELRYTWFEEIRKENKYTCIATAHHRDDSIETFFINLIRGTGIAGLHGILPKQGNIIRPLLFATKNQIMEFAEKEKIKFREDSSNASDKYMRNKIRHQVIPVLKELNPSFETTMNDTIQRLIKVEEIYDKEIEGKRNYILNREENYFYIRKDSLNGMQPLETYLFEFLKPFNFNSSTANEILLGLNGESGKQFFSSTHRLVIDREVLIIEDVSNLELQITDFKLQVKKNQKEIIFDNLKLAIKFMNLKSEIPKSKNTASLDFDKLVFPLEIRKWQQGDKFYPFGMKGKKKLSDFFIDNKVPLNQKENTWLLTSDGKIAWVIGMRIDNRFKITHATKKIYFAELVK